MSTTLLFAELLIVGIQVIVWFVILILSFFGYDWVFSIQTQVFSGWQVLITIIVITFVYVLGILFDRLADIIFSKWDRAIGKKFFGKKAPYIFAKVRFQISKDNDQLNHEFEYSRSRQRIARASSLNFAITTVLAIIFVGTRLQGVPNRLMLLYFIAGVGSLLTILAIVTWYKLINSYYRHIQANLPKQVVPEKEERIRTKVK